MIISNNIARCSIVELKTLPSNVIRDLVLSDAVSSVSLVPLINSIAEKLAAHTWGGQESSYPFTITEGGVMLVLDHPFTITTLVGPCAVDSSSVGAVTIMNQREETRTIPVTRLAAGAVGVTILGAWIMAAAQKKMVEDRVSWLQLSAATRARLQDHIILLAQKVESFATIDPALLLMPQEVYGASANSIYARRSMAFAAPSPMFAPVAALALPVDVRAPSLALRNQAIDLMVAAPHIGVGGAETYLSNDPQGSWFDPTDDWVRVQNLQDYDLFITPEFRAFLEEDAPSSMSLFNLYLTQYVSGLDLNEAAANKFHERFLTYLSRVGFSALSSVTDQLGSLEELLIRRFSLTPAQLFKVMAIVDFYRGRITPELSTTRSVVTNQPATLSEAMVLGMCAEVLPMRWPLDVIAVAAADGIDGVSYPLSIEGDKLVFTFGGPSAYKTHYPTAALDASLFETYEQVLALLYDVEELLFSLMAVDHIEKIYTAGGATIRIRASLSRVTDMIGPLFSPSNFVLSVYTK